MVLFILVIFVFFTVGILVGLILSGFFGTLDEPSSTGLAILKSLGLENLESIKISVDNVLGENIRIPFNVIAGIFSNPTKMSIDIGFKDYAKLEQKREEALLSKVLIASDDDWVSAKIKLGDEEEDVRLRLKGDWTDHLEGDKWSFRINVKGDKTLNGMEVFSIQDPATRVKLSEYLYHRALGLEDIISLRYEFIDVTINGDHKGIYALEEHFDKRLIENNNRREGVFIKFDEDLLRDYQLQELEASGNSILGRDFYSISSIDTFQSGSINGDPIKSAEFNRAKDLLESFRQGKLKTSDVFVVNKLSTYYALTTVLGTVHGSGWHNGRFYYNPVISKLEPIGYDGSARSSTFKSELLVGHHPSCVKVEGFDVDRECDVDLSDFEENLFSDPIFFEAYASELERISSKDYLDNLFEILNDDLKRNLRIIHKDNPTYHFPKNIFYYNAGYVERLLNPPSSLEANYEGKSESGNSIELSIGNINYLPVEILSISNKDAEFFPRKKTLLQPRDGDFALKKRILFDLPIGFKWNESLSNDIKIKYRIFGTKNVMMQSILPWGGYNEDFVESDFLFKKSDLSSFEFIKVEDRVIRIQKGNWIIEENLIIPANYKFRINEGTTLDLVKGSVIISYSPLEFIGAEGDKINIKSSDGSGEGISVLNADGESKLRHVVFSNLKSPSKNGWSPPGAINFYESNVEIRNVDITGMMSEDSLNIVRSNIEIEESVIRDSYSDCFDLDFSIGRIKNVDFINCGNDGVDFSGSDVDIEDIFVKDAGDKGISVGEKSKIEINGVKIDGAYICVASKDDSELIIRNISLGNCKYGFAVYQKKPEFGPSSLSVFELEVDDVEIVNAVEKKSIYSIDEKLVLGNKNNLYRELYGDEI
jgi:hypothetical protein